MAGFTALLALSAGVLSFACTTTASAQTAAKPAAPHAAEPAAPRPQPSATPVDPFPAANLRFFTAASPSTATVESFLHAIWGYDPNRMWRVEGIQKTDAPGVSKITVYADEKAPNAKVQAISFFVLPDGKHAIAGEMTDFGATPFADRRQMLENRADGPSVGPTSRALEIVEFADLQCPHCKAAQGVMKQLEHDFPTARFVFQNFPLTEVHPAAFQAAADGVCVAKHSNAAFFTYAQAVFDTQEQLTPEATARTLAAAITKAGLAPADIESCAATTVTKENVEASVKLANDAGISATPTLVVNGRPLPLEAIPYETLKNIIMFQASLDGIHVDPPQPVLSSLGK
ncbi:MAG TPA: DsbA family protein [Granulicella sp.]|nr:DsbA family protein [Granulicella sp.]